MYTLEQISCFRAVFETRGYSAAGRMLGKSRATVREHVLALEDLVGEPLFLIQGKRAEPTAIARRLYPQAKHLARQAADFERVITSAYELGMTELVILHDTMIPVELMSRINRQIRDVYPELVLSWLLRPRDEGLAMVEQGEAHMALMGKRDRLHPPKEVGMQNLGVARYAVYVGPQSPLVELEQVTLNDLASETQYISETAYRAGMIFTHASSRHHVVSSTHLLGSLVSQDGWAVLPEWDARPLVEQGELVQLDIKEAAKDYQNGVILFFSLSRQQQPTFERLVRLIHQACDDILT